MILDSTKSTRTRRSVNQRLFDEWTARAHDIDKAQTGIVSAVTRPIVKSKYAFKSAVHRVLSEAGGSEIDGRRYATRAQTAKALQLSFNEINRLADAAGEGLYANVERFLPRAYALWARALVRHLPDEAIYAIGRDHELIEATLDFDPEEILRAVFAELGDDEVTDYMDSAAGQDMLDSFTRTAKRTAERMNKTAERAIAAQLDAEQLETALVEAFTMFERSAGGIAETATWQAAQHASDVVIGRASAVVHKVVYRATLDTRTCPICGASDGQAFDWDDADRPTIPRHPRCRCHYVPALKEWRKMGIDPDDVSPGTRASMDGLIPDSIDYPEWLRKQSPKRQLRALGRSRFTLYRKGVPVERFVRSGTIILVKDLPQPDSIPAAWKKAKNRRKKRGE